ncbi:hypothetical protein CH263_13395 [Rhodococcus sp. 06-1059B-a]|nr:hypothetical protein [Rhodococcus sp. 06-1059B-a]OZD65133.1 hypothetical protein CH263_13395 [Rhodococcus sp. 06-1059B-a]
MNAHDRLDRFEALCARWETASDTAVIGGSDTARAYAAELRAALTGSRTVSNPGQSAQRIETCEHHLTELVSESVIGYCTLPADHAKYDLPHSTKIQCQAEDGDDKSTGVLEVSVTGRTPR